MKCPKCKEDITKNKFTEGSLDSGFLNVGYRCDNCKIDIYCDRLVKSESEYYENDEHLQTPSSEELN